MAKAKHKELEIEKVVIEKENVVELTLSIDEANTLLSICGLISGPPKLTHRKDMESISAALRAINIRSTRNCRGDINFPYDEFGTK